MIMMMILMILVIMMMINDDENYLSLPPLSLLLKHSLSLHRPDQNLSHLHLDDDNVILGDF